MSQRCSCSSLLEWSSIALLVVREVCSSYMSAQGQRFKTMGLKDKDEHFCVCPDCGNCLHLVWFVYSIIFMWAYICFLNLYGTTGCSAASFLCYNFSQSLSGTSLWKDLLLYNVWISVNSTQIENNNLESATNENALKANVLTTTNSF